MNKDYIEGNWTELKGKVREQWGRLTDDQLDQVKGTWRGRQRSKPTSTPTTPSRSRSFARTIASDQEASRQQAGSTTDLISGRGRESTR